mgnify:CR=1 FL=1
MMREKIKPETGIVGVIKTDGYGHGAVPIAKALENECVGYAVATAWEGHNLRRHGIDKPLYILGVVPENLCDLVLTKKCYHLYLHIRWLKLFQITQLS